MSFNSNLRPPVARFAAVPVQPRRALWSPATVVTPRAGYAATTTYIGGVRPAYYPYQAAHPGFVCDADGDDCNPVGWKHAHYYNAAPYYDEPCDDDDSYAAAPYDSYGYGGYQGGSLAARRDRLVWQLQNAVVQYRQAEARGDRVAAKHLYNAIRDLRARLAVIDRRMGLPNTAVAPPTNAQLRRFGAFAAAPPAYGYPNYGYNSALGYNPSYAGYGNGAGYAPGYGGGYPGSYGAGGYPGSYGAGGYPGSYGAMGSVLAPLLQNFLGVP